jgi:hypothetical protein
LIEKIALEVELYRLFMNEPGKAYGTMDQTTEFLTHIPCDVRRGSKRWYPTESRPLTICPEISYNYFIFYVKTYIMAPIPLPFRGLYLKRICALRLFFLCLGFVWEGKPRRFVKFGFDADAGFTNNLFGWNDIFNPEGTISLDFTDLKALLPQDFDFGVSAEADVYMAVPLYGIGYQFPNDPEGLDLAEEVLNNGFGDLFSDLGGPEISGPGLFPAVSGMKVWVFPRE